jgi:FAD/FMN-containing dehydrogenase
VHDDTIDALHAALGPGGLLRGDEIEARHCGDLHGRSGERPIAVARPRDTAQVARVLTLCHAARLPVVTHGGRSGLVRACLPRAGELVLTTERMSAIEEVDADDSTATVQAGVILQSLEERLQPEGLLFPLDLGGRGSCTIGGNIATNAGGNRVIRYGMTRDLVLGLEAVLADGTVLDGLRPYVKNNTGVDLKQLFIGTEGVLGVVTRAVLRLVPLPGATAVAFCGLASFDQVRALLRHLRRRLRGDLTAFEVLWKDYYSRYLTLPAARRSLPDAHAFYVLTEGSASRDDALQERFEQILGEAIADGVVEDAVLAKSGNEARELWEMRDRAMDVSATMGPHSGFDISLRVAQMSPFADELAQLARELDTSSETLVFGHAGDGNLHVGVSAPRSVSRDDIERAVYGLVRRYRGSISAEHGIGITRLPYLGYTRSDDEIATMRALKHTLDPHWILNPGRLLAEPQATHGRSTGAAGVAVINPWKEVQER